MARALLISNTTFCLRGADVDDESSEPVAELVSAIESYLRKHPDASDSLSGIRDWWLKKLALPAGMAIAPGALNDALERLVEAAVLERVVLPGGECIFRARRGLNAENFADDKR